MHRTGEELRALSLADQIWCVSRYEASLIERGIARVAPTSGPAMITQVGLRYQFPPVTPTRGQRENKCVMVGHFDVVSNQAGLRYLLEAADGFPDDLQVQIIGEEGRTPDDQPFVATMLKEYGRNNFTFLGRVDDTVLDHEFATSLFSFCFVPPTGLQQKIWHASRFGTVPVITRGLASSNDIRGDAAIIVNSPGEVAGKLIAMCHNADRWESMSAAIRLLGQERCSEGSFRIQVERGLSAAHLGIDTAGSATPVRPIELEPVDGPVREIA